MRILIIGLIFIISPNFSFGHNPLSARYDLQTSENGSLLTINLSQDGVNKIFLDEYGEEKFAEMTPKVFKELIVAYIKNNFDLSINNEKINLGKGGIKLGSHQTDLKFVLPPVSGEIKEFTVAIPAFQENENHQNIFTYNLNNESNHVILNNYNDYESTVTLIESEQSNNGLWLVLMGCLVLGGILFYKNGLMVKKKA